jgi:phage FluMu protein Com
MSSSSSYIAENAKEKYKKGVEFLKLGKPLKAIPLLEKALESEPKFEEANFALHEAKKGLLWGSPQFCHDCGKLLEPLSEYPYLKFEEFCPKCGEIQNLEKEEIISAFEVLTKMVLFGVLGILLLIFCAMPNLQLTFTGIWYLWNHLSEGIFLAMNYTPIIIVFLILINDPWGFTISKINFHVFVPLRNNPALYFAVSVLFLIFVVYVYFFLLLTPFLAICRKNLWKTWSHQKKLLVYTLIFSGFIVLVRIASGVFY